VAKTKLRKLSASSKLDRRRTIERQSLREKEDLSINPIKKNADMLLCAVGLTLYSVYLLYGWYFELPRVVNIGTLNHSIPQNVLPWFATLFSGLATVVWKVTLQDIEVSRGGTYKTSGGLVRRKKSSNVLVYFIVPMLIVGSLVSLVVISV